MGANVTAPDNTIVCKTCGGSDVACAPGCHEESEHPSCPDCIRGRQPTVEVRERMAQAIMDEPGFEWQGLDDPGVEQHLRTVALDAALAAWLAEHAPESDQK